MNQYFDIHDSDIGTFWIDSEKKKLNCIYLGLNFCYSESARYSKLADSNAMWIYVTSKDDTKN